jgi:hypothetical protein
MRSSLGLRANRQPDKPVQRFGTQLAFGNGSGSPRVRFAKNSCPILSAFHLAMPPSDLA